MCIVLKAWSITYMKHHMIECTEEGWTPAYHNIEWHWKGPKPKNWLQYSVMCHYVSCDHCYGAVEWLEPILSKKRRGRVQTPLPVDLSSRSRDYILVRSTPVCWSVVLYRAGGRDNYKTIKTMIHKHTWTVCTVHKCDFSWVYMGMRDALSGNGKCDVTVAQIWINDETIETRYVYARQRVLKWHLLLQLPFLAR